MSISIPNPAIQYVAVVRNVKEVTLFGTADLKFWRNHLIQERLLPFDDKGKADISISATELRWMGVQTRELTFSISVCAVQTPTQLAGLYLIHAFNSSKLFAAIERALFQTPYYWGDIQIEESVPSSFKLRDAGEIVLKASMPGQVPVSQSVDEMWEGAIFLPQDRKRKGPRNLFYAKLGGQTETYPFSPMYDILELNPNLDGILRWLSESKFTGKEWRIKSDATHARSKTYKATA